MTRNQVRLDIERREPFAGGGPFGNTGPYERLYGKATLPSTRTKRACHPSLTWTWLPGMRRGWSSLQRRLISSSRSS